MFTRLLQVTFPSLSQDCPISPLLTKHAQGLAWAFGTVNMNPSDMRNGSTCISWDNIWRYTPREIDWIHCELRDKELEVSV